MAPPPAYASAAPRRRPSPRVPVPSMDTASFRRYLLTKRVLSLEEFRQEMRNKWSSSSPAAPASKAIPVPLYPGETLQQYTFKFKKWLTDKGEDLAVMRNDPNRERSFWHSFAHHRVGMLSTLTPPPGTHPKGQKRSVEDDYDDSYHRSASIERKRVRREKAVESERGTTRGAPWKLRLRDRCTLFLAEAVASLMMRKRCYCLGVNLWQDTPIVLLNSGALHGSETLHTRRCRITIDRRPCRRSRLVKKSRAHLAQEGGRRYWRGVFYPRGITFVKSRSESKLRVLGLAAPKRG